MIVKRIDIYKDGGTFIVETDAGNFYIDRRIGNPINPTKGFVFNGYPEQERGTVSIVATTTVLELKVALSASTDRWADWALKSITHDIS